ncbi:MAG: Asp-tRNA(Asn)/Glu-tRNA(Gln) amidotransferase subunit GatC [Erysipelotrichaceae bacterium]|nr:Asp-tRNA(Asn)/Glu-tRNA(Gln) amidotransferase subunit GatC [Erysipelotrichaceae bacterium]
MERLEKNDIQQLAKQLMFELTEEEAQAIQTEFDVLQKQLQLLEEIDTEGVEEMVYPFETPTSFLREDEVENVLSVEDALKNAKRVKTDYIVLPKVVK